MGKIIQLDEALSEKVQYTDVISLKYRDPDCHDDHEIVAQAVQQPNCLEACISPCGQKIIVHVEREFFVEVVGKKDGGYAHNSFNQAKSSGNHGKTHR